MEPTNGLRASLLKLAILALLPTGGPLNPCPAVPAGPAPAVKAAAFSGARVYPNPFYPGKGQTQVNISGLPEGCAVKVYTLSGELVWEGKAVGGLAAWNGRSKTGRKAASGLYLVYLEQGEARKISKLSLIR